MTEPVTLADAIAALAAAFPLTPERQAANARLLDEEVAAWEAEHETDAEEPGGVTPAEKLVRDRIPDIIRSRGGTPDVRTAGGAEYRDLLRAKLREEAAEAAAAGDGDVAGELADVLEVVAALAADLGISAGGLEQERARKAAERGGFAGRVVWRMPAAGAAEDHVTPSPVSDRREHEMSDPIVYRSTDPGVLSAWKDACAAVSEYLRQTQTVLDTAGLAGRPVWRSRGPWDWGKVRGVTADGRAPDGWRAARGKDYAVPDLRTSAGRKVSAALAAVPHPGEPVQRLPGMPADVLAGAGRVHSPDVRVLAGAVYAEWDLDPGQCETSFSSPSAAVDSSLWQRVKLSEYYAARELAAGTEAA